MSETIQGWLAAAGRHPEGGLRFVDRNERTTWFGWAEVRERALGVAGGLLAMGIQPGDRVALVFRTGIEFFEGFFGAQLAGAVPVPLYPPLRLGRTGEYIQRTARMLARSGARLVLADSWVRRLLDEAVALAGPDLACWAIADLPRGEAEPFRAETADLALIQFSSGTTVDPKPVALSHRAIAAQVRILNGFWQDTNHLRHSGVSWLPLYHDMGLIGCVFPALSRDAELTLIRPEVFVALPGLWLRTLSRYGASVSAAPNFAYDLCVTRIADSELDGVDLSGWRAALNGAEPIAPPVLRAFSDRFARWGFRPEALTPVYGLSEAVLAVTFSDLDRPFRSRRFDREELSRLGIAREAEEGREIVSVGRPVPGFRLRIVDEAGLDLPPGRVGRVWIKGPSLMEGYLDDPETTSRAMHDGWLDTGDLGFMQEGELYLSGRAKDAIILRGRNYAPEEIERAVGGVAGVRSAAAASWLPEDAPGELLALFVEVSRQVTAGELEALPDACRDAVLGATGLAVDRVVAVAPGALPLTSSGKLRRGETLRLYLAGELEPAMPAQALSLAGDAE